MPGNKGEVATLRDMLVNSVVGPNLISESDNSVGSTGASPTPGAQQADANITTSTTHPNNPNAAIRHKGAGNNIPIPIADFPAATGLGTPFTPAAMNTYIHSLYSVLKVYKFNFQRTLTSPIGDPGMGTCMAIGSYDVYSNLLAPNAETLPNLAGVFPITQGMPFTESHIVNLIQHIRDTVEATKDDPAPAGYPDPFMYCHCNCHGNCHGSRGRR